MHMIRIGKRRRLSPLVMMAAQARILVGGQAVIEGVMMRVPGFWAVAVRDLNGKVQTKREPFSSLVEKYRLLKLPLMRGMIHLFESMKLGMSTLNWSADIAFPEEASESGSNWVATALAIGLAIGLFFVAPLWLTTKVLQVEQQALEFNLVSGAIRIVFFIVYLLLISLADDVKRLFQYHGAEHKTVFTFEAGQMLIVDNARKFSTFHPRCGTSFLFIVLIAAILTFALIDTIVLAFIGKMTLGIRLVIHLPLIPLVAGVSYEVLKLTAKYQHIFLFRWLSMPGMWLQRITTKPPDDEQLQVAIDSLKLAFGDDLAKYEGKEFLADAIG